MASVIAQDASRTARRVRRLLFENHRTSLLSERVWRSFFRVSAQRGSIKLQRHLRHAIRATVSDTSFLSPVSRLFFLYQYNYLWRLPQLSARNGPTVFTEFADRTACGLAIGSRLCRFSGSTLGTATFAESGVVGFHESADKETKS